MNKKKKITYVHRLVRHEVNLRCAKWLEEMLEKNTEEMRALAGSITELAERMEDIDGSLWDSRHAAEVQSGRLMELARMLKEKTNEL